MFEKLVRNKVRFNTDRGILTVEDLWDLPLTSARGISLDSIYKSLNKELKANEEEGLAVVSTPGNSLLKLKAEAVKYIFGVKQAENEVAVAKLANKAQKEKILGIIAQKQDEALVGKSLEELTAMVNSL